MPSRSPASTAASASRADAVADHGGDAGGGGHLGGDDLRAHAAGAERRGRVADLELVERREVADLGDDVRVGVQSRVGGVEAVDVGQQDQLVGADSTATCAARKSLSPKEISSVAVVSFSLITGSTRHSSSVLSVWRAFR